MEEKIDFDELRIQFHQKIMDRKTSDEELIMMWDFFKEHACVVDNQIKKRAYEEHLKNK